VERPKTSQVSNQLYRYASSEFSRFSSSEERKEVKSPSLVLNWATARHACSSTYTQKASSLLSTSSEDSKECKEAKGFTSFQLQMSRDVCSSTYIGKKRVPSCFLLLEREKRVKRPKASLVSNRITARHVCRSTYTQEASSFLFPSSEESKVAKGFTSL
jgi:hypothetical protein